MQGDIYATEDSQDNMFPVVTRGTRADKVLFTLGSKHSQRNPDTGMITLSINLCSIFLRLFDDYLEADQEKAS
jgi:hypothetical protein